MTVRRNRLYVDTRIFRMFLCVKSPLRCCNVVHKDDTFFLERKHSVKSDNKYVYLRIDGFVETISLEGVSCELGDEEYRGGIYQHESSCHSMMSASGKSLMVAGMDHGKECA